MIQAFEVPLMCSIALACLTGSKLNCDRYICYKASHFLQVSSLTAVFLSLIYNEKGIVIFWASSMAQLVKNSPANVGDTRDMSLIPGSERSPGEGNDNALQYPCLENSMDRGAWRAIVHGVAKSQTQLSVCAHTRTHTHTHTHSCFSQIPFLY